MRYYYVLLLATPFIFFNSVIARADEMVTGIHYECDPKNNVLKILSEDKPNNGSANGPFEQYNDENSALFAFDFYKGKTPIKKLCKFSNKRILAVLTKGPCPSLSLYLGPSLMFVKSDEVESIEKPFLYSNEFGVGGCRGANSMVLGEVTVRQHPDKYDRGLIIETK